MSTLASSQPPASSNNRNRTARPESVRQSSGTAPNAPDHERKMSSRNNQQTRKNNAASTPGVKTNSNDSPELAILRAKYHAQLAQLQNFWSDWSDEDALQLLAETKGNVELAGERILDGMSIQVAWH